MGDYLHSLMKKHSGFRVHELFIKELSSLINNELSGHSKEFASLLIRQLTWIDQFRSRVHETDNNEILKYVDKTYSIHLQRKNFNIRLLIYITEDDRSVYFLSAFYERSGKKESSYEKYTPVLKQRIKDMGGIN